MRTFVLGVLAVALGYVAVAYLVLPRFWADYERQPGLAALPMTTVTRAGIPGDPINIGLVATEREMAEAMSAAGWTLAKSLSLASDLGIVRSVVFNKPDLRAPVSNLFYAGRPEDLAFEQATGPSAARRHHVRFWKVLDRGAEGRPVWLGAASFDVSVGFSRYTGEITHHIAPDVDAERDRLIGSLEAQGSLTAVYRVAGRGPTLVGRNGEGDRYVTDGEIEVGVLRSGEDRDAGARLERERVRDPVKPALWTALRNVLAR